MLDNAEAFGIPHNNLLNTNETTGLSGRDLTKLIQTGDPWRSRLATPGACVAVGLSLNTSIA